MVSDEIVKSYIKACRLYLAALTSISCRPLPARGPEYWAHSGAPGCPIISTATTY